MLSGHASAAGTARYRDRFANLRDAGHFRQADHVPGVSQLWLSSIGLGTYLGDPSDAADQSYMAAIEAGLLSGINVLDTAINYRHQRSERNIGAALKQMIESGELHRDEILIGTKAGYLSFDGNPPPDPRAYFHREYVETGVLDPAELAGGMHCMSAPYLENQIERSRRNLGLEVIDLFYIHNPESQLADVSREVFRQRLKDAFALLEKLVKVGKLQFYGVATWSAFRVADSSRDYMDLAELAKIAHEVAGEHHRFRFIQLPFNLAMPEAYGLVNQRVGKEKNVVALSRDPPGDRGDGQRHALPGAAHPGFARFRRQRSRNEDRRRQRHSVLALRAWPSNFVNRDGPKRARGRESETCADQPHSAAGMEKAVHPDKRVGL